MSGILERIETKLDVLIAKLSTPVEPVKADVTTTTTPVETVELVEVITADPYEGVDCDGVVWDKRIHSKAKEPKSVTTGKWKRKKGITDKLYDDVTAELQASPEEEVVVAQSNELAEALATPIPPIAFAPSNEVDEILEFRTPAVPIAPPAPEILAVLPPAAPDYPQPPLKEEVLTIIKYFTSVNKVEPNDITSLMLEVTGHDTISKLDILLMQELKNALFSWQDDIDTCGQHINEMIAIAEKHGYSAELTAGVDGILEQYDADCVGLVHYTAIKDVKEQLEAYLTTWQEL